MGILSFLKAKFGLGEEEGAEHERAPSATHGAAVSSVMGGASEPKSARGKGHHHHHASLLKKTAAATQTPVGVNLHNYNITSAKVLMMGGSKRIDSKNAETTSTGAGPTSPPTPAKRTDQECTKPTVSYLPPEAGSHCFKFDTTQARTLAKSSRACTPAVASTPAAVASTPAAVAKTTTKTTTAETRPAEPPYKGSHCAMFSQTQAKVLAASEQNRKDNRVAASPAPVVPSSEKRSPPVINESPELRTPAIGVVAETPSAPEPASAQMKDDEQLRGLALYEITQACYLVGSFREKRPNGEMRCKNKTRRLSTGQQEVPHDVSPLTLYNLTQAKFLNL